MSKIFWFTAKWTLRVVICFLLFAGFMFAKTVQTWEEPCSAQSTPYYPDPCGEDK